ncbi:MAG: hypothetical protein LLG08_01835 [Actinomycetia bacterium]|nr:hypothetical protein [Actinomycetes bacterium]
MIRWIAVLPCAIAAGVLAGLIVGLANRTLLPSFIDPGAFLSQIWIQFISSVASGAAMVFVATYIAPTHKKSVGAVFVGLGLLFSGADLVLGLLVGDYWSILRVVSFNLGTIGVASGALTEDHG